MSKTKFNSIEDIEKAYVDLKKDAVNFCMDTSITLENRVKAFNRFGSESPYIHEPNNPDLRKIFSSYGNSDYVSRRETSYCDSIVEWWLQELEDNRIKIITEKYNIKLERTPRNYEQSQEAIDRLYAYYMEIILKEGISKFTFDW